MDSRLADRIERLEQIGALEQGKYRQCAAVDASYAAADNAAVFTEDGVWDGGDLRCLSGRDAIYRSVAEPNDTVQWLTHGVINPIIDLVGDEARCQW